MTICEWSPEYISGRIKEDRPGKSISAQAIYKMIRRRGNEHLKKLDDVIADVYDKLAMRGIMIVIFGGKSNPMENGMCMIRVKKPCREDLLRDHFPNQ